MPEPRLTCRNVNVSNEDPLPKASSSRLSANLQIYCEFNAWQVCSTCKRLQPRDLTPAALEKILFPYCGKSLCMFCRNNKLLPEVGSQPLPLRQLPSVILDALKPVQADFGPMQSSKDRFGRGNGYRVHASMVAFCWRPRSVVQQIAALPGELQTTANHALEWLLQNSSADPGESAYGDFWEAQLHFLQEHGQPEPRQLKRWLRFIESEGLECALWPHLFTQRRQCLTWARLQSTSRQARGQHRSTLEQRLQMQQPAGDAQRM
eukprot:s916_g29.t1